MNTRSRSWSQQVLAMAALLVAASLPAPADEPVLQGFEHPRGLKTSGKVTPVQGADAVTEGASALQLAPGAAVTLVVPPNAISQAGWLKIDTFEVQPVMASVRLTFGGRRSLEGHVRPGKDTLALPLGLVSGTGGGPWPKKPVTLEIRNAGRESVVVDNVRTAAPAAAPAGAALLDFGPSGQVLWPGFESAGEQGSNIAWSGQGRIYTLSGRYPDPLLSDFAGLFPAHMTREILTINSPGGPGVCWAWLTHYGTRYSPALEYMARLNNRQVLHRLLSPSQMLSPEGLLEGKDQPWTTEWFEDSFVPKIISKAELPLKEGANSLLLANCQVAALIVAPRAQQQALRGYVQQLEGDLKGYRRQFILAAQRAPHCDVPPTEEESKTGIMVFAPPPDEWFNRVYAPTAEHRADSVKLVAASGTAITTALVAVPCKDGRRLQVAADPLRDPGKGVIPASAVWLSALERTPAVRSGAVYYQPFLPVRDFRAVRGLHVYWFFLRIAVPDRTRPGDYQGTLRFTLGEGGAGLPVELKVHKMYPARPKDGEGAFGVLTDGNPYSVYRSLAVVLPTQRQQQTTRDVFSKLFAAGVNCGIVPGVKFSSVPAVSPTPMLNGLRACPRPAPAGKTLVDLRGAIRTLEASNVQPATALYAQALRNLVRFSNDLADKSGLGEYALYIGDAPVQSTVSPAARLATAVRRAGGKPAVHTNASLLARVQEAERAQLLKALDTVICRPNHKELGLIQEQFKATGSGKTLVLGLSHTDVYACGFYCWAVGADGLFVDGIFSASPIFNPFWFDGRSLLVPTAQGGFEPTLALLQLSQGIEDYALAQRCEALVKLARARRLDTQELDKALADIRLTADSKVPSFDPEQWRSRSVSAKQLEQWRVALFRAAGKISQQLAPSGR